jgi:8-oxo-dGTP diphosphatase
MARELASTLVFAETCGRRDRLNDIFSSKAHFRKAYSITMISKPIRVVCAIIEDHGKTLCVQRSDKMKMPLKWEFPGGKVEWLENEEDCIQREIKEELDLNIEVLRRLAPNRHQYDDFLIELIPFLCRISHGRISLKEHRAYLWLTKAEMRDLDWAEADIGIVEQYFALP